MSISNKYLNKAKNKVVIVWAVYYSCCNVL